MTCEYTAGTELPDIEVTWRDSAGAIIPFASQAHTFSLRVPAQPTFVKGVLGGSQTGITTSDTAPNVTIAFAAGDLDDINPATYRAQLWARRTSDSKDRQPLKFDFVVGAAVEP